MPGTDVGRKHHGAGEAGGRASVAKLVPARLRARAGQRWPLAAEAEAAAGGGGAARARTGGGGDGVAKRQAQWAGDPSGRDAGGREAAGGAAVVVAQLVVTSRGADL